MRRNTNILVLVFLLVAGSASADSANDLQTAKKLYERITGLKVSAQKAEVKSVASLLSQGKKAEAVKLITSSPDFINVQIRNLSLRLSNKDESVKVPFNDFAALITGIVRDDKDFREVLTANYYYDITGVANETDRRTRYFNQDTYVLAESTYLDLNKALVFKGQQEMVASSLNTSKTQTELATSIVTTKPFKDAAGVLSTRTFAERTMSGGTNRRAVEFTLKQFLCVSMADAADSNASDQFVGRDVERFPAGDYNKYTSSCKSCHSVMDGMRGAFAKMELDNFSDGGATTFYAVMNGGFYIEEGIAANYNKHVADIINPTVAAVIPDLENNQANSDYYKVRYDYMISRGTSAANAKASLDNLLNTIRDPAIAKALIVDYRVKNATKLADFRANMNDAVYRTNYVKACLDHFANTALTAQVQEENFLQCNLDSKKELSEIYALYNDQLVAAGTVAAEKDRLLNKLINRNRDANVDIINLYLSAKDKRVLFARNSFDSTTGVAVKMNKGSYPYGFVAKDDSFVNNAVLGSKATFFGWRGANKDGGKGLNDFGHMISESRRFSQCMAKRVYEGVCLKKMTSDDNAKMQKLGDRFEALKYNLKSLYQEVALDSACGIVKGN